MVAQNQKWRNKSALQILEEAVHLLRHLPASHWVCYLSGATPFGLGLFYFWVDMSQNAKAEFHCIEYSLILSALYLWMKWWHMIFIDGMRPWITQQPAVPWTVPRFLRAGIIQAIVQPSSLVMIPLASLLTLPYGWVSAFYHNVSYFGNGTLSLQETCERSVRQTQTWPGQNHILLSIVLLVGIVIWVNVVILMFLIPHLFKMLTGIETVFTLSGIHLLNTTFWMASVTLSFLILNPLSHAIYALRCFYGESIENGLDLKTRLPPPIPVSILIIGLCSGVGFLQATESPPIEKSRIESQVMNQAIEKTFQSGTYDWRFPREAKQMDQTSSTGGVSLFFEEAGKTISRWYKQLLAWFRPLKGPFKKLGHWISGKMGYMVNWLQKWLHPKKTAQQPYQEVNWQWYVYLAAFFVLAVAVCVFGIFIYKRWQKRHRVNAVEAVPLTPMIPDLTQDDIHPDQLPPDEWESLAQKMTAQGEWRLALRALYLAGLAYLARNQLLTLARHKSNRDYERELLGKAHVFPKLTPVFRDNMNHFERAWYGLKQVSQESFALFQENHQKILSTVTPLTSKTGGRA